MGRNIPRRDEFRCRSDLFECNEYEFGMEGETDQMSPTEIKCGKRNTE